MNIVSVVGARPQFIKLYPIANAIPIGIKHEIIHTGQHYDDSMSEIFFDQLNIPRPKLNLNIGSGSHAQQTASMMTALEEEFLRNRPDMILVYGDTNSTLAAAIAASKINLPVAHLEAGLRSFNRRMPEEVNRVVTDHLSNLLLAPTNTAMSNLKNEGLLDKSVFVGDVMVDAIKLSRTIDLECTFDFPDKYIYASIHRADNTETKLRIQEILGKLEKSPLPVLLVLHPRFKSKCHEFNISLESYTLNYLEPQPYLENLNLLRRADGVITDSGGIQKEAYLLKTKVLTIRRETEWLETIPGDCNVVDYNMDLVSTNWYEREASFNLSIFGDGNSATRVIQTMVRYLNSTN